MQIHESHSMNLYTKYVFLWDTGWKSLLFLGLRRRIFPSTPCWNNRIHQLLKNTHNMNVFLSFLFIRVDWHQCTITEFSFCYMNFSTICTILWPISNRAEKNERLRRKCFHLSYRIHRLAERLWHLCTSRQECPDLESPKRIQVIRVILQSSSDHVMPKLFV